MISMIIYFGMVSVFCAYILTRTMTPDADYLAVLRIACCMSCIANGIAVIPDSIWFSRPWSMTIQNLVDALIYGLHTGGLIGWLG